MVKASSRLNVGAIVAHPDDEVLACGATLARLASMGTAVHILVLATGQAARGNGGRDAIAKLRQEARSAADILGARSIEFGDYPDNRMDTVARLDVVQTVEAFLKQRTIDHVITHHPGDINVDHGVVARAVMTATRPVPGSRVSRVWAGEVPSSSEWGMPWERFSPQIYVDVGATIEIKLQALAAYKSEMRPFPHPRSPEALTHLAGVRGAECGHQAAEAFVVLREIIL